MTKLWWRKATFDTFAYSLSMEHKDMYIVVDSFLSRAGCKKCALVSVFDVDSQDAIPEALK